MRGRALIATLSTILIAGSGYPVLAGAATGKARAKAATTTVTGGAVAPASSAVPKKQSAGHKASNKHAKKAKPNNSTKLPAGYAPITARTPKLEYNGPIYELSAAGSVVPYVAPPPANTVLGTTGGEPVGSIEEGKPRLLVPGSTAELIEGLAAAPMSAPEAIQDMIWAGNEIVGKPYVYGGGHNASFKSVGYDCSGTVSYALHGASLIKMPMDSSEMMRWGESGAGKWVTIFANPGHAYMTIAGLRLDTSSADDPSNLQGPRWRPLRPANAGFVVRHPEGL